MHGHDVRSELSSARAALLVGIFTWLVRLDARTARIMGTQGVLLTAHTGNRGTLFHHSRPIDAIFPVGALLELLLLNPVRIDRVNFGPIKLGHGRTASEPSLRIYSTTHYAAAARASCCLTPVRIVFHLRDAATTGPFAHFCVLD